MTNLRFIKNFIAVQMLVLSPFFSSVYADDTEIFFNIEQLTNSLTRDSFDFTKKFV